MKKSFSLLEILIVIGVLVLLLVASTLFFNPKTQVDKANDGKRKEELSSLKKVFEDWYNDKGCYPLPPQICYDGALQRPDGTYVCHICGNQSTSPSLSPYLSQLPCDPRQPVKKYLYQVDSLTCPSLYRTYTSLSVDPKEYCVTDNPVETEYNWGVSSSNTQPLIDCTNLEPTITPTNSPGPTTAPSIPVPTPEGSYYCQGVGDCQPYDNTTWTCVASFFDSVCTGSSNCAITSSCSLK